MPQASKTLKISSQTAAAAFEHPQSRRVLLSLIGAAKSLGDLQGETGLSLSLLHYHVGRLRRLGLIEIESEEPRHGRPVKRYRACAERFFVPAAFSAGGPGEALSRQLKASLDRERTRRGDEGVEYHLENGKPRMSRVCGESEPSSVELWMMLSLTSDQVRMLASDLRRLLERYHSASVPNATPMIAYCAFAEQG